MSSNSSKSEHNSVGKQGVFGHLSTSVDLSRLSVLEARHIMGDSSNIMSDSDIEKAIYDLTAIARAYIKSVPK